MRNSAPAERPTAPARRGPCSGLLAIWCDASVIPYASRTAIYYCLTYVDPARCQAPLPTTPDPNLAGLQMLGLWTVDVNCAAPAGLATLIPWTKAVPLLAAAAQAQAATALKKDQPGRQAPAPEPDDDDLDEDAINADVEDDEDDDDGDDADAGDEAESASK